jgi:glycosyltransferase involved in cell wall biosynthesis
VIRQVLLTDLERESVVTGRRPLAAWYGVLGELMGLGSPGLQLPAVTHPFDFDQLRSRTGRAQADGPLISVVMPVFAPDVGLITAVRSILDQTWQHLEVLIIDDASPEATRHRFEEVAALDERVRVIRKPRNDGTYSARNTALTAARGLFITGQDADDWSHPERLERQARPLLGDRSLVATLSRCLRVTDDLRASSLRASGSSPTRVNSSSLMFRRTEVMHRLGYYDRVRKGADSEFIFRLRAVFGGAATAELRECLALVRLAQGSLSRSDFLPGWHHESRIWYREMYTHWHRGFRRDQDGFLAIGSLERPFPAPQGFTPGPQETLELDDVFIADLRYLGREQEQVLIEARRRAALGRRVGLAHLERLGTFEPAQLPFQPTILQALFDGEFTVVEWSRDLVAKEIVVWPADLLEYHSALRPPWRIGRVNLVADATLPLSRLSETLGSWAAGAAWATTNLPAEHGVELLVPPTGGSVGADSPAPAGSGLSFAGRLGPGRHRSDVVVLRPAAAGPADPLILRLVDALRDQGATARVVDVNEAVRAEAPPAASGDELDGAGRDPDTPMAALTAVVLPAQGGRDPATAAMVAAALAGSQPAVVLRAAFQDGDVLQLLVAVILSASMWWRLHRPSVPPSGPCPHHLCRPTGRTVSWR